MNVGIESKGATQVILKLEKLVESQTEIARRAVMAGTGVAVRACRDASPGAIKTEVGRSIKVHVDIVTGKAGLMRFPRPGKTGKGPHGVYLEHGTKYITARHFIRNALAASRSFALAAMQRSVNRSIENTIKD